MLVVCFVDDNWHLQQCVVRLMLLAISLKGEEVARQLIMCLSNQIGITSNQLVAAMWDSAILKWISKSGGRNMQINSLTDLLLDC